MRLKKTTVLTGNHAASVKQQRNRAQSENEIFTSQFKGTEAKVPIDLVGESLTLNNSSPQKKYVPKNSNIGTGQPDSLHPVQQDLHLNGYVAYRKKSHAL